VNKVIKEVNNEYNTRILKATRDVTVKQIKGVIKEVLIPAFMPGIANVVVTCRPIIEDVYLPRSLLYAFSLL
jgi:hypothetical protein